MVEIRIAGGTVSVEVMGWHKLWALRGRVEVPVRHITAVRADPDVSIGWGRGVRLPGTHVPGRIKAGTYYEGGRKVFWDVTRPARAIVVDLSDDRYDRLVVEVEDPAAAVTRLQDAVRRAVP